jgi:small GTP-binding protein
MASSPSFRAVFIGPESVGKTCLIRQLGGESFLGEGMTLPSVGAAFTPLAVKSRDGNLITFGLWDTPGQASFRDLMLAPLRNADIICLVFDISEKSTLQNLRPYFDKAKSVAPSTASFIVVGNKCDLEAKRQISLDRLQEYAEKLHAAGYLEASAKTGAGIMEFKDMLAGAAVRTPGIDTGLVKRPVPKQEQHGCNC